MSIRRIIGAVIVALLGTGAAARAQAPSPLQPFKQEIPKAAYSIEMLPVPGDAAGRVKPFWISKTEITWQAFDCFIYKLDEGGEQAGAPGAPGADAVTRPTKPYLPPDRGFGHEGYAAITMSHACAAEFCKWLSMRSGRTFRLATEDEWEVACGPPPPPSSLAESAWFADNADAKPHAVATKKPNTLGLYDMLGNVAEWVDGRDGKPVVKGGCYRDSADKLTPASRQPEIRAWNASDPQVPKSTWWLADAPFIGFRIVCEPPPPPPVSSPPPVTAPAETKPAPGATP